MKRYTLVDYSTQIYSALVAILILFFHNHTVPLWRWLIAGHVVGIVLVHWLIRAQASHPTNRLIDFLRHFYPVLLYTAFFCETGNINLMFFPSYLDPAFIRADLALFGFEPGASLMSKLPFLPVSELLYFSYFSYYLMIVGMGLALYLKNRHQFFHYVTVISFVFYICYVIFIFLPVVGPQVLTEEMPNYKLPPDLANLVVSHPYPEGVTHGPFFHLMAWIYRVFETPGSAFPSSHVAIALCTVYFSFRYLRRIWIPHLIVAILLSIATVYCHYHYGVDVLGGILTTAILLPLANSLYKRLGEGNGQLANESNQQPS